VWGSSKPSVSVDGQLAVRGARTGVRLAESRSRPKVETDFQRVSASCRSTETLHRELQQTDETVHERLAVQSPSYSNVLSNRHKMSDFENLGVDDGELLRVACAPEATVRGKACGELGLYE